MTRTYTTALLEEVEAGTFDKDALIADLVGWMSEADVKEFVRSNDLMPWLEDDSEEDEEWDGQPDEAQEWHDFDPDC